MLKTKLGGKFHGKLNAPSKSCNKNKKQLARRQCWRFWENNLTLLETQCHLLFIRDVLCCCICLSISIWSLCWIWHCRQVFEVNDSNGNNHLEWRVICVQIVPKGLPRHESLRGHLFEFSFLQSWRNDYYSYSYLFFSCARNEMQNIYTKKSMVLWILQSICSHAIARVVVWLNNYCFVYTFIMFYGTSLSYRISFSKVYSWIFYRLLCTEAWLMLDGSTWTLLLQRGQNFPFNKMSRQ